MMRSRRQLLLASYTCNKSKYIINIINIINIKIIKIKKIDGFKFVIYYNLETFFHNGQQYVLS